MEKVWIRKGTPKEVIESSAVHYFYWPIEIGLTTFKVSSLRLPIFPLKLLDYEPVKIIEVAGSTQVISRFHYRVILYFNRPSLVNARHVVDFSFGSHSPFVHSDGNMYGSVVDYVGMDSREIDALNFLRAVYEGIMSGKLTVRIDGEDLRDYQVSKEKIPEGVALDMTNTRAIIWVGEFPERSKVPEDIAEFLQL